MMKKEELKLTQDWDKTFPKSDKVDHCKVTFVNRYGITLAADMYSPKEAEGKLPQGTVQRTLCADHGRERIPHGRI